MTLQDLLDLIQVRAVTNALEGRERFYPIEYVRTVLNDANPRGIEAVIYVEPTIAQMRLPTLNLVTIARFGTAYPLIERMSRALVPVAMEFAFLPIVVPIPLKILDGMTGDTPFIRRMESRGTLLYRGKRS